MDFVAVMLFTQEVFHLNLYLSITPFGIRDCHRIKSEHGIACQSISYVKLLCNLVTWRNNVLSWVYFYVYYFMLFLFHISLGCYWQKCQKGA